MLIWHDATKEKPSYGVKVLGHNHCSLCARNERHPHTLVHMPINPGNFETVAYVQGDLNHPLPHCRNDHFTVDRITHWAYIPIPVFDANGSHVADIYKGY